VNGARMARYVMAVMLCSAVAISAWGQPLRRTPAQQPQGQDEGGGLGQRPEPQELQVDPDRPKTGEAVTDPIVFDYVDAPLIEVINELGALTGHNFNIVDKEAAQDTVTVITHQAIPAELAVNILESVLNSRGFAMVPTLEQDGKTYMYEIINIQGDASTSREDVPIYFGEDGVQDDRFAARPDSLATHIVPIKYASVEDLQSILETLGSKNSEISAYVPTNTLVLTDTVAGLNRMLEFLRAVDVPGFNVTTEIFELEFTRAEVVATQLVDVLLGPEGEAARAARATPSPSPAQVRRTIPGQGPQGVVVGAVEETLRVVHDERLNAVIVVASEGMMGQVRDLIIRLDQPTPPETENMHVYELLNADAEIMSEALNNMISGTTPRAGGQQPEGQTADVQPFEKTVTISPYIQTNALLVLASPQDFSRVREIIARLDVPQRQVNVESVIMDVIINDNYSLDVDVAGLDDDDFFGFANAATIANAIVNGPLSLAGSPGGTIGVVDGTTEVPVPTGDGSITTSTVPNIPLLIQMVESLSDADILSQPSLTTVDNEDARIIVGQEVPFITGSSSSLDQSAVGRSVFNRIEREDVGIQLEVTPQISEGDYIFMDLAVEVSQTVESDIGADVNLVGPTVQKSEVAAKVSIPDGSTGIIGGLVSENMNRSRSQTPILGDIPLLGFFFKNRGAQRSKRNLVVLVTPTIVRDGTDLERFTDFKLDNFTRANMDVWFQEGFIKRIKNKHDIRKNYRPSDQSIQEYRGGRAGFNRGKME